WLDREGAGPQLARTGPCSGNRRRARHIGCLRSIQINLTSRNHLHSVVAPICLRLHTHTNSPLRVDLDECRTPEAQSVLKDTERARCRSASTRDTRYHRSGISGSPSNEAINSIDLESNHLLVPFVFTSSSITGCSSGRRSCRYRFLQTSYGWECF